MAFFQKVAGTIASFFQLGGPSGPAWKANGGAIEGRNAGDTAFAIVRGATPVAANDLVTKTYADANGGGWTYTTTVTAAASPYTAAAGEWVWVDATSGPVTVVTPTTASGNKCRVTKTDVSANLVTMQPASGTYGGQAAAQLFLSVQDQMREVWYDGTTSRIA